MTQYLYQETLQELYRLLPMYQRVGAPAAKMDLHNTQELCWELGMPQWKFPSIHVAGTNGKGSVSSMLASILQEAGYKTGLYTSPHLTDFTERIRINGEAIRPEEVVEWVGAYRLVIERLRPSFFEVTVGMAFEYFAEQEVDIAIVETGLGGRLDSTNVLRPEVSVITQIGMDHMEFLGDTLAKIAGEKAGIIKRFTPVVVGRRHPETDPVFAKVAFEQSAALMFAQDQYKAERIGQVGEWQQFAVGDDSYEIDLQGHYQGENLVTALQTVDVMREDGWEISQDALRRGLRKVVANTGLRGRMEQLQDSPRVLCDIAHNPDGLDAVLPQVLSQPHQKLHIVWGMVKDKDYRKVLEMLPREATYYFVAPDLPRALQADVLQGYAAEVGLKGESYASVQTGIEQALQAAQPEDLLYIGGSTFVVAEALPLWQPVSLTEAVS